MRPNILLVVMDSVRAQNTSLEGYERNTTPFLKGFANTEATRYTEARAPGMTSMPSHTSMFTGLDVEEHQVYDSILHKLVSGATVWEKIKNKYGYSTGVFSYNPNLVGDSSLRGAFDHVDAGPSGFFQNASDIRDFFSTSGEFENSLKKYSEFIRWCMVQNRPISTLLNGAIQELEDNVNSARLEQSLDRSADYYVDSFLNWRQKQSGPWAACINLLDTHYEYYPRSKFDRWGGAKLQRKQARISPNPWKVYGGHVNWSDWNEMENLYDGTIRQVDSEIKNLIHHLKEQDEFDDTLIVITSDHGDGFGERSRVQDDIRIAGHAVGLHEVLLHVPLVVSFPGQNNPEIVNEISTLRKFHDVVLNVIEKKGDREGFVPEERPVIASGTNVDQKLKNPDRAAKYCHNTGQFSGTVRAVYDPTEDHIKKHMTWRESNATVEITSGEDNKRIEFEDTVKEVEDEFSKLDDSDVRRTLNNDEDLSQDTLKHLEDLGYV